METRKGLELDLKRAITKTMAYSAQKIIRTATAEEIITGVAEGLVQLESLEAYYYGRHNVTVNFWCGTPTEQDLKLTIQKIRNASNKSGNTKVICNNCERFSSFAIKQSNNDQKLVRACTKFLSANTLEKTLSISDPDLQVVSLDNPLVELMASYSGDPAFGAFIYDQKNDIGSVILIPKSSKINWDINGE